MSCEVDDGDDASTSFVGDGTAGNDSIGDTAEAGSGSATQGDEEGSGSASASGGDGDATASASGGDGDDTASGTSGDGDDTASGTNGDGDTTASGTSGDGDSTASGTSGDGDGDSTASGTSGDGDGDSTASGTGGDGDGEENCTCAPNADLIYLIGDNADLYSFNPITLNFTLIANLGSVCPESSTFSMSVDRNARAWILMQSGNLYQVDINNPASCVNSGWVSGTGGYDLFGMGFVSNSISDPCDQLYMHSWSGSGGFSEAPGAGTLGRMSPSTLAVTTQGTVNFDGGELTGNVGGQLFAFAGSNPAKLVQYEKSDASVVEITPMTGLDLTNAFAFATWEGKFYFFTESSSVFQSKVTRYDPMTSALDEIVAMAPMRVVGAGVSTCAPLPQ